MRRGTPLSCGACSTNEAGCGMNSGRCAIDIVSRAVEFDATLDEAQVTVAMIRLDQIWDQLFPGDRSESCGSWSRRSSSHRTTSRCG